MCPLATFVVVVRNTHRVRCRRVLCQYVAFESPIHLSSAAGPLIQPMRREIRWRTRPAMLSSNRLPLPESPSTQHLEPTFGVKPRIYSLTLGEAKEAGVFNWSSREAIGWKKRSTWASVTSAMVEGVHLGLRSLSTRAARMLRARSRSRPRSSSKSRSTRSLGECS